MSFESEVKVSRLPCLSVNFRCVLKTSWSENPKECFQNRPKTSIKQKQHFTSRPELLYIFNAYTYIYRKQASWIFLLKMEKESYVQRFESKVCCVSFCLSGFSGRKNSILNIFAARNVDNRMNELNLDSTIILKYHLKRSAL